MKRVVIFLFLIAFLPLASAQYIIGDIYLKENGDAFFNLDSDVDLLIEGISFSENKLKGTTDILINKYKGVWTFTLDLGEYEIILIDIHLPKNTDRVFSLEGVDNLFDLENRVISLIDSDKELFFEVSYQIKNTSSYVWVFWLFFIVIVLVVVYWFYNKRTKHKKRMKSAFPFINDNEKKILDLLVKGEMRQKEVRKKLDIPKASFTRYILHLEKKKLLFREGEGKNKVLRVK